MTFAGLEAVKVLVADDHEPMRLVIATILRGLGLREIVFAEDGVSGLTALKTFEADVVVTDLNMHPMDGLEFVKAIRRSPPPLRFTPVIMVTGHAQASTVFAARDAGVSEFIAKPLAARDLAHRLQRIVDGDRTFVLGENYAGPDRRRTQRVYEGPKRRESDRSA